MGTTISVAVMAQHTPIFVSDGALQMPVSD
jgi:hypothetical protein